MEERILKELDRKIQDLRRVAEEIKIMGANIPAIERNTVRILASIKMLELNVSDVLRT
jgi:hypothetical protein